MPGPNHNLGRCYFTLSYTYSHNKLDSLIGVLDISAGICDHSQCRWTLISPPEEIQLYSSVVNLMIFFLTNLYDLSKQASCFQRLEVALSDLLGTLCQRSSDLSPATDAPA
ncbi:hypothetical protein PoB_000553200 [Plakobranchus ocellatus]|uniref:Uncharacterized protein n=1 Tax=Plakobranchus ocellatus TaxID=259542 RepID=A0AAV3YA97_9GAST|nr:hypothetical protein PoB_000553200 [Plakobranchus ocellatus]